MSSGICEGGDFPNKMLSEIFERIKNDPISLKEDAMHAKVLVSARVARMRRLFLPLVSLTLSWVLIMWSRIKQENQTIKRRGIRLFGIRNRCCIVGEKQPSITLCHLWLTAVARRHYVTLRKIAAFVEERGIEIEKEKEFPPLTYASLGNANKMCKAENVVAAMVKLADFNACLSGDGVGVPLPSKIHITKAMAVLKTKIKLKSKEVMCVRKDVQAIQAAKRAEEEHHGEGGQAIFARRVCHRSQLQSFFTPCR
jgi:hypothetical protein